MATDALKTLVRVRKIREKQAELELAAARAAEVEQEAIARATQQQVRDCLDHRSIRSGEDLARGHLFALHLEVGVRHDLSLLEQKRRLAQERRRHSDAARLSRRVVEAAQERAEARARLEAMRPHHQALDELGMAAWWRRRHP